MAHRTLIEQHVTVGGDAWNAASTTATALGPADPSLVFDDQDEHASGRRGALRRTGRAILFTFRAIGAILGILIAGMTVAILAAVQRLLHLG